MTILETFIRLRDDLKLWVTNNLNTKADISYVDDAVGNIDNVEVITVEDIDTICGSTISYADPSEVVF